MNTKNLLITLGYILILATVCFFFVEVFIGEAASHTTTCGIDTLVTPEAWLFVSGVVPIFIIVQMLLSFRSCPVDNAIIITKVCLICYVIFGLCWFCIGCIMTTRVHTQCEPDQLFGMIIASLIIHLIIIIILIVWCVISTLIDAGYIRVPTTTMN